MNYSFAYAKKIASDIYEIKLDALSGGPFSFRAGQYMLVKLESIAGADSRGGRRNFSITSSPRETRSLTFAFQLSQSAFKQALVQARSGMSVEVEGPFGIFTLPEDAHRPLIFIALGIGITACIGMIKTIVEEKLPYPVTLYYEAHNNDSMAYTAELEELQKKSSRLMVRLVLGSLDEARIRKENFKNALWYIAGMPSAVADIKIILGKLGVADKDTKVENFVGYHKESFEEFAVHLEKNATTKESMLLDAFNKLALISETDLEGTITYANDMFTEVSKYSRQELIGQNHRILKSGFHPPEFYQNIWNTIRDGKVWKGEIKNKAKDGTFYWVDSSIGPLFDEKGFIRGYIATRFPITARKEAEEKFESNARQTVEQNKALEDTKKAMLNLLEDARDFERRLQEERDRMQAIIASIGDGVLVIDKAYKIALMNDAGGKLLSIAKVDALGKTITEVYQVFKGNDEVLLENRPLFKAIQTGKATETRIEDNIFYKTKDGKKFPVTLVTTPLYREKDVVGAVMVFRDITEEKKLDDSKTGFISIASHQLRTPLTSMRWFSEMLIAGDAGALNDEQKHFVERIYQGTDRMIDLVNLLLQIARVEGGRVKIQPIFIDFKTLTKGVELTLKTILDAKMQTIDIFTGDDHLPLIPMDQEVVWQVVQNLLSNASRYSPEKSVIKVAISLKNSMLEYSVKDDGIGIPVNQQSRLFEKFFRAENALKAVPEGSGLGLSLVKSLVEDWGGKIWFASEEGKGSTFFFTVPLTGMKKRDGQVGLKV